MKKVLFLVFTLYFFTNLFSQCYPPCNLLVQKWAFQSKEFAIVDSSPFTIVTNNSSTYQAVSGTWTDYSGSCGTVNFYYYAWDSDGNSGENLPMNSWNKIQVGSSIFYIKPPDIEATGGSFTDFAVYKNGGAYDKEFSTPGWGDILSSSLPMKLSVPSTVVAGETFNCTALGEAPLQFSINGSYEWKVNGIPVSQNSATISLSLTESSTITCRVTDLTDNKQSQLLSKTVTVTPKINILGVSYLGYLDTYTYSVNYAGFSGTPTVYWWSQEDGKTEGYNGTGESKTFKMINHNFTIRVRAEYNNNGTIESAENSKYVIYTTGPAPEAKDDPLLTNSVPSFSLKQNHPNPFNPTTQIGYTIAEPCQVTLKVYDIQGQEIKCIVNEMKQPGTYRISFDGGSLPSGVYLYRLQAGNFIKTKKMHLLK